MKERKRIFSNAGNGIKVVFGSSIDKCGNILVKPTGKHDLYAEIQEYAEIADVNNLVKRFENGDVSALQGRKGQFIDLTEMPTDYFEMVNKINDAKHEFSNLPLEIKKKFDNDENKFIATIGQNDWFTKLFGRDITQDSKDIEKCDKSVISEVKEKTIEEIKEVERVVE